jgi:prepilin-type N-terminal cleavage/methylation domain-containing protein
MTRARFYRPSGFTLVEMLVVIVIISILSGAGVVALQGRTATYSLRKSADDLAEAVRYAINRARIEKVAHRVVMLPETNSVRVERAVDGKPDEFVPIPGRAGLPRPLAKHAHLVRVQAHGSPSDVASLVFDGNLDNAETGLELRDDSGAKIQVLIMPASGQIVVR